MPTDKRLPVARKAFQPSRSRLLQPSELFRKSRPDASDQPQPTHPPPKNPDSITQTPLRAQRQPNLQFRNQTPSNNQNDAPSADPESAPIPRIPRIPRIPSKASSSLSNQKPGFAKTATPFVPNKAPNTQRALPLLSRSQVKPHSFPLRSSNQPALQSSNQPSLLKSRNQISVPAKSRSAQPQGLNKTSSSTTQTPPPRSSEPLAVKGGKLSAFHASVAPASSSGNATESRHSQESTITIQNAAPPPVTADVSVQQLPIPFPLSTLPPHVLHAMSKSERDGFVAGWSAGWAACVQSMHNEQNGTTALVRSPMSGKILSAQQNLSPVRKQQQASSSGPAPIHLNSPEAARHSNSPVIDVATTRRRLSDPYENDGLGREPVSVGAYKRPRTSHPTHPNTHTRSGGHESRAPQQAPSPTQVTNTRSTSTMVAFATATTHDPMDVQRKKRKRSETENAANPRRRTEGKAERDPRRQSYTGPRSDSRHAVRSRTLQSPSQQVPAGSRHEVTKSGCMLGEDAHQQPQVTPLPDRRQQVQRESRQDPKCSSARRNQQESERQRETRSGQGSGHLAGAKECQQHRWLSSERGTPPGRLRLPNLPPANSTNVAYRQTDRGDAAIRVARTHAHGVEPHTDQRQGRGRSAISCPQGTTGKITPSLSPNNRLPIEPGRTERVKISLPRQATVNIARRDMDMQAPDSQEESGWGTALNAATSRGRVPSGSKRSSARKNLATASKTNGTCQQPPPVPSRDSRRKQRPGVNIETTEKSAESRVADKERDDITVQAYAERFGLVIVERNHESGKVEWVACKFCPVFGCRTRDPDYIMAHRAPFYTKKIVAHLEKDHCVKWKEYTQSNAKEKGQFFSGKVLPTKAFRDRVAELKRTPDGIARRPVAPVITAEAENALIDKAVERLTKKQVPTSNTTIVLNTTDECWIGRHRFGDKNSKMDISAFRSQTRTAAVEKLPRLRSISECIKELEINSDIAGLILHGVVKNTDVDEDSVNCNSGFTDTIVIDGDEMRPTTILFANLDKAKASRVALALRHMYYGVSGRAWQDDPEVQMNGGCSGDSDREIFGYGNAIMGLGMHMVSRALTLHWALGLKTRSCRYVSGKAVEVLVSVRHDSGAVRAVHLVTVQDVDGAGEAVTEVLEVVLPCWKERLIGVQSGVCRLKEEEEKRIEGAILEEVRKACGRELLVVEHNVLVEEKPIFPWSLSKMCETEFNSMLSSIEVPLGLALGKARLEAAKAQRKELFSRIIKGEDEQKLFDESWKITGERAAEIYVVAEGLRNIWMCDCGHEGEVEKGGQRREEETVVDSDAERVLWARGVVDMWTWCKKVVRDLGMESPS